MHSPLQLTLKYLNYYLTASNGKGHGIHSPFVFEFVTRVLNGEGDNGAYKKMEDLRAEMRRDETEIAVEDFGAGSRVTGASQRKVSSIARTSLKPKKYGQLMHRVARHYQPRTILEIGTSLGITTSYLAKGNPSATVITMEGSPSIARIAQQNFEKLGITNIRSVVGNFDETLGPTLSQLDTVDLAFIDGNHRYEPTTRYFNQVLAKSNEHTIIILDDIYWSREMEQAWQWVKAHGRVRLTIDLFAIGIVVLRPEILHKQHFRIRF
jgi:predicted O-methyltransferase YrrM